MRDILVTLAVLGTLPFIFRRPWIGILVFAWLSYMNPHRMAWGFSTTLPFAFIVFATTVAGYLASKEPRQLIWSREATVLFLFVLWMFVTTVASMYPWLSWVQWDKVWRIQLATLLTLMLILNKERLVLLIWTMGLSIGVYGFKGGLWVLMTGGAHRVQGPAGTFIGGNNELGLALIMTVPLLWFMQQHVPAFLSRYATWVRNGLRVGIVLVLVAIVGTHSRGALVGIAAMGLVLILRSRKKFMPLLLVALFALSVPTIMPEHWFERMETIQTYEEDDSAMERIRAWTNAIELAGKRFFGGGYDVLIIYGGRDAHSIYFEVLGEHGYVGLALFLTLGLLTLLKASAVIRLTKERPDQQWAADLARMIQVSLIGYATAGAFLGLAYFDFYYHLVAAVTILYYLVVRSQEVSVKTKVRSTSIAGLGPAPPPTGGGTLPVLGGKSDGELGGPGRVG